MFSPDRKVVITGNLQGLLSLSASRRLAGRLTANPSDIFVTAHGRTVASMQREMPDLPRENVIGFPIYSGTALSALAGITRAVQRVDDSIVLLPAGTAPRDVWEFEDVVEDAIRVTANQGRICLIGSPVGSQPLERGVLEVTQWGRAPWSVTHMAPDETRLQSAGKIFAYTGVAVGRAGQILTWVEEHYPRLAEMAMQAAEAVEADQWQGTSPMLLNSLWEDVLCRMPDVQLLGSDSAWEWIAPTQKGA